MGINETIDRLTDGGSRGLEKTRAFFGTTLFAAAAVEIFGAFSTATWADFFRYIALNLTLGGGAGMIGAVLGFIFGIPKTSESTADDVARSRVNTNLGQISDWLTKILVGASLTSIAALPHFLVKLVNFLDHGAYQRLPGGGTLAVFVILYFSALGFYWSYLETRTIITALFDQFSHGPGGLDDVLLKVRSAPADPGSPGIPEDTIILGLDPDKLTSVALLEARAAAETRVGNYSNATKYYQQAAAMDPGNPRLQNRLSVVLAAQGKTMDADAVVRRLQTATGDNPPQRTQVDVNKVLIALYKPPPGGFTEAIETGQPLLDTDQQSNGQLQLWLACAYAQRAGYNSRGQPVPPSDPDRLRALQCLQAMKKLRPDLLPQARSLWRPKDYRGTPQENDLEVFSSDQDFERVLV